MAIEVGFTSAFREIARNTIRSMPLMLGYCGTDDNDDSTSNVEMKAKEIRNKKRGFETRQPFRLGIVFNISEKYTNVLLNNLEILSPMPSPLNKLLEEIVPRIPPLGVLRAEDELFLPQNPERLFRDANYSARHPINSCKLMK